MENFFVSQNGEPGMAAIALVALCAGLIRGFTGFGGPAFFLAILTLFFTPFSVVSKILVVDFFASLFLFRAVYREIDWQATLKMTIPTLLFLPVGHWLLHELDPTLMKRAMAVVIAAACIAMLTGLRYRQPLTNTWLILVGAVSGIVFGGTYIALITAVCILLGPYDKHQGRTLIISWALFTMLGFALIAAVSGTVGVDDLFDAAPGAAAYLLGTWLGSRGFQQASEQLFRRAAIVVLLILACFNLVL